MPKDQFYKYADAILHLSRDLFCIASRDGYFLDLNERWSSTLGYTKEELCSRPYSEFIHPDDVLPSQIAIKNLLDGEEIVSFSNRYIKKDGTYCYLSWDARFEPKENTLFAKATDITEFTQNEMKLSETTQFLRKALDYMPGPVYSKDNQGRYLFVNSKFLEVVPLEDPNIIGKKDSDFMPPDIYEPLMQNDQEVLKQKSTVQFREEVPHPDGSLHYYDTYKFPLLDNKEKPFCVTGISLDITEKIHNERELEIERGKVVQTAKLVTLGEMASGVAHELNNPLGIIMGFSKQITKHLKQDGELDRKLLQDFFREIYIAGQRMEKIITGLKYFSRDGSLDDFVETSFKKILDNTLSLCESKIEHKQIDFKIECETDFQLQCREVQISQVLLNLIDNAFDAVLNNKNAKKWISLKAFADDHQAKIIISDSGTGISREIADKLFEPFFTTKPVGKGTGLGMSISQGIIQNHHGLIEILSEAINTTFKITIPLKQPDTDAP